MISVTDVSSDLEFVRQHREVWEARPELRSVYHQFFARILHEVGTKIPVVELGAGPGFFKEYCPSLISTDFTPSRWIDVVCDGCMMPFPSESLGAIVMLDVLHHLPRPMDFIAEATRVLRPGGVIVMIEPWITPASYLLYRYFHHEDCTLKIDIESPFQTSGKKAFDGNAAIPYNLVRRFSEMPTGRLQLVRVDPFLGLPYLATLGFKRVRPIPARVIRVSQTFEKLLGRLARWNATRALLVWEKRF